MELSELLSFKEILKDSFQILPKNGKIMALIAILYCLLASIFFSIFNFSLSSLLRDMLIKESFLPFTSSNSADFSNTFARMMSDFRLVLLANISFLLAYFLILFVSSIAAISVSASSYTDKPLSIRDLTFRILKSWTRPLITSFYTMILVTGYFFFCLGIAGPLMIPSGLGTISTANSIAIVFFVFAFIFYLYLSVAWELSLVISVIEENCGGIQALGKAGALVSGKRLQGFILNILFMLLSLFIFQVFKAIKGEKFLLNQTIVGLFLVNCSALVKILKLVAYTVLYFHCKRHHGEEIELQGAVEYTKLSKTPFMKDIP